MAAKPPRPPPQPRPPVNVPSSRPVVIVQRRPCQFGIKVPAVIDAEVVCTDEAGRADFNRLHSRCFEEEAIACAFGLLKLARLLRLE